MSELQISSIIAASSLVVFLASPHWGRLSDRWGRKRVMVIGLFGYACGNLALASVFHLTLVGALLPISGYLLLMLTRVMHASVMSAIMPSSSAYMADITSIATRTKGMGAVGAANNFGSILGPTGVCLQALRCSPHCGWLPASRDHGVVCYRVVT